MKKLNSNSNLLTLKKLNSNSLILQKSNSNSNSSITRERIQTQISKFKFNPTLVTNSPVTNQSCCVFGDLKDLHWKQALSNVIDNVLSQYHQSNISTLTDRNNVGRVIKTYHDKYSILNSIKLTNKTEMLKMQR